MINFPKTGLGLFLLAFLLSFTYTDEATTAFGDCNEEDVLCGDYFYRSHSSAGYYTYPAVALDVSCISVNSTVSLNMMAHDVPNRFYVKKNGSSTVASTGWLGCTSEYGPWGGPFCNSASATLNFTRESGASYTIIVETVVHSTSDYWEGY